MLVRLSTWEPDTPGENEGENTHLSHGSLTSVGLAAPRCAIVMLSPTGVRATYRMRPIFKVLTAPARSVSAASVGLEQYTSVSSSPANRLYPIMVIVYSVPPAPVARIVIKR